jgi:hypothetical protein
MEFKTADDALEFVGNHEVDANGYKMLPIESNHNQRCYFGFNATEILTSGSNNTIVGRSWLREIYHK